MNKSKISKAISNEEPEKPSNFFDKVKSIYIQLFIAFCTGILAIVSMCQYQTGITSMRTTNRAYLNASPWIYGIGGERPVRILLENFGQSPAGNITESHTFQVIKNLTYIKELKGLDRDVRNFIGKGDTIQVSMQWEPLPSEATRRSVLEGDSLLVLNVKFRYVNIFDEHCTLKHCFIWAKGGRWQLCDGQYQKQECN